MRKPEVVKVVYHYAKTDNEFVNDYHYAEIYFDGKPVLEMFGEDDTSEEMDAQIKSFFILAKYVWGDSFPVAEIEKINDSKFT
jgi:hypothetical protein